MLYRPGSALRVWDLHDVDTLIVRDELEEREARGRGWTRTPGERHQLDHDGDGAPGGSLSGEQSTARRGRRRKEAQNGE
jgi:hypothetical protein